MSPLTSNTLALHGEGGPDIGPPSALLLPATMKDQKAVHNATHAIVQAAFTQHDDSTRPVEKITNIATTAPIMQLAPIPAYLVYDSFEQELGAAKVH